jgi:lipoprotein-anchoring transpeptidase ErfK/SrfK
MHARLLASVAVAVAATGGAAAAANGAAKPPVVKPTQELVRLVTSHDARSALRSHATTVRTVPAWRPITGEQTVLPVVDHATTADGVHWLRVMMPGRPNGAKAWIRRRGTEPTKTTWHLVVRTATRRVLVYRHGRLARSFAAVVGKPSTPTPRGHFFVEESVRMPSGSAGAPYALASSARSDVLQEFEGGPGQIAIHGVQNLAGDPGTAVSHGCIRLADADIRWLAARISPGAPLTIGT